MPKYLSTDPNAGVVGTQGKYLSTDPNAGLSSPQDVTRSLGRTVLGEGVSAAKTLFSDLLGPAADVVRGIPQIPGALADIAKNDPFDAIFPVRPVARQLGKDVIEASQRAVERQGQRFFETGDRSAAFGAAVGGVPLIGPAAEEAINSAQEGRIGEAFGHAGAVATGFFSPNVVGSAASKLGRVGQFFQRSGEKSAKRFLGPTNQTAYTARNLAPGVLDDLQRGMTREGFLESRKPVVEGLSRQGDALVDEFSRRTGAANERSKAAFDAKQRQFPVPDEGPPPNLRATEFQDTVFAGDTSEALSRTGLHDLGKPRVALDPAAEAEFLRTGSPTQPYANARDVVGTNIARRRPLGDPADPSLVSGIAARDRALRERPKGDAPQQPPASTERSKPVFQELRLGDERTPDLSSPSYEGMPEVNTQSIAQRIRAEVDSLGSSAKSGGKIAVGRDVAREMAELRRIADRIEQLDPSYRNLEGVTREFGTKGHFDKAKSTLSEKSSRSVNRVLREELNKAAEAAGIPDLPGVNTKIHREMDIRRVMDPKVRAEVRGPSTQQSGLSAFGAARNYIRTDPRYLSTVATLKRDVARLLRTGENDARIPPIVEQIMSASGGAGVQFQGLGEDDFERRFKRPSFKGRTGR